MSDVMEKIVSLCKRRGFIFPGSEIYGGLGGTWDLGPLGVLLAHNIKKEWWSCVVEKREDVVGLDSSVIASSKVWKASGHVSSFTDPLIECKVCHARFRADHDKEISEHEIEHGKNASWTEIKDFNLMFKTHVGPIEESGTETYLRPETAQGIFINFKNVIDSTRINIPFGIAQIGKGFRNEITIGNFLFRAREFEMMELEFFVKPGDSGNWFDFWREERMKWYASLGIKKENIKVQPLDKANIAHYSKATSEIWYNWPFMGFGELEGIANRGDYDLSNHSKASGVDLSYFDEASKERFVPYVIEPSVGVGRAMLAFLIDSYSEDGKRVVLKLHPKLAPYKVAVFPLLANKPELVEKARKVYESFRENLAAYWDDRGNIGKRYLYQDEIGTPYCLTIDFQTLDDDTITVRDRDSAKQERISVKEAEEFIKNKLNA